jgi:ParB family chromosome partitioning protein
MATKQAIPNARHVSAFAMNPNDIVIIGRDTPHKRGEHDLWRESCTYPVNEGLVAFMRKHGWFGSIVVKKDGDNILVGDGNCRTVAARALNIERLATGEQPMLITVTIADKTFSATDVDRIAMAWGLNEHRQEMTLRVRADNALRLRKAGMSVADIGVVAGVPDATVEFWLRWHDMPAKVQSAVELHETTHGRAGASFTAATRLLAGMSKDEQQAALDKLLEEGGGRTTEAAARAKGQDTRAKKKDPTAEDVLPVPPRRLLKKIVEVETAANGDAVLHAEFLRGVRYATGLLNPKTVAGLTKLIANVSAKKAVEP